MSIISKFWIFCIWADQHITIFKKIESFNKISNLTNNISSVTQFTCQLNTPNIQRNVLLYKCVIFTAHYVFEFACVMANTQNMWKQLQNATVITEILYFEILRENCCRFIFDILVFYRNQKRIAGYAERAVR